MGNKKQINGYALSRIWFDFVFETTETVTPIHAALYFWIIDLANRLGWKDVFGLPTGYSMEAIGLKSYRSYKKALDDLIRWGFIELRAKSFNQHSSNQIALVLKAKAEAKADEVALVLKAKAQPKQRPKQSSHNKTIKTEQTLKKGEIVSPETVFTHRARKASARVSICRAIKSLIERGLLMRDGYLFITEAGKDVLSVNDPWEAEKKTLATITNNLRHAI